MILFKPKPLCNIMIYENRFEDPYFNKFFSDLLISNN